jgi:hypothetical protein
MKDLRFSRRLVGLVRTEVSEEHTPFMTMVEKISEPGMALAATVTVAVLQLIVTDNIVPCSLIFLP